ncbi:hypothetical protein ACILE9_03750 [Capnocytophaga cynodegmi]|uniref:hypothetical protein n=1 Tax=Capnocytophaga cynodegmi TaxID=28189 RepID=UPI0037D7A94C
MKLKTMIFIIFSVIAAVSCEREKVIELSASTIEIENYSGEVIAREPSEKVFLNVVAEAPAGISKIEVLVLGKVVATENPENAFTYNYEYEYDVPATATLGEEVTISFKLEDKQGHSFVTPTVIIRVAQPFEIADFSIGGKAFKKISGRINKNIVLTNDQKWLIDGVVSVDDGANLTINEGTTVYFRTFNSDKYSQLVIMRGGKITASGTRLQPIVFTSDKVLSGTASREDWGGIYINGSAPTNAATTVLLDGFRYGGNNPDDNSGTLKFVRIEYTGKGGLHSLQLNGVGSKTTIEYVQSFDSYNNAFRLRGGRVSLRYIAGIQHGGYGIWADEGWQGNGQFWIFQTNIKATLNPVNYWNQARSIEFRNDNSIFDKQPRTTFKVSNVTLIGNGSGGLEFGTRRGVRIRRGAEGLFHNSIITEFPSDGVRVEDLPLERLGVTTKIDNIHSFNNAINWEQEAKTFFFESGKYNLSEKSVSGITRDNFVGVAPTIFNSTSLGSWFVDAPYIGAVEPSKDWTKGGEWFKNYDGTLRK